MRILIVDDDPSILILAGAALGKDPRFRTLTAMGGKEALEAIRKDKVDACLIDYRMTNMDGLDLMRHLHAEPGFQGLPVVFCSAKRAPSLHASWVRMGAKGVIPKPFNPETLADEMARLLGLDPIA